MNQCNFIGNLGKDWDIQYKQDGKAYAKNTVAVKKYDKSVMWVSVIAFGKNAENLAKYTAKGSQIGLSGELDIREYEGKYYTSLKVLSFSFCGNKGNDQQQPQQPQQNNIQQPNPPNSNYSSPTQNQMPPDDGIPF